MSGFVKYELSYLWWLTSSLEIRGRPHPANLCTAIQSKKPSLSYGESPKEKTGYRVICHGYTIPNRIR